MKISRFIVVGLIALAFVVAPFTTNAQSVEELQRQIAQLMAQIRILQNQQGTGTNQWCHTFEQNLGVGTSGAEVGYLQTALEKEGFKIGDKTSYYGEITAAAVSQFQLKYKDEILTPNGLSAPTGYFGPATRAVLDRLYGCQKPIDDDDDDKKIIWPMPKQSLTVVSPNGGESWQKGTDQLIQWSWKTDTFVGQQFTIYLNPASQTCPDVFGLVCKQRRWEIAGGVSGTSYYKWNVGKTTTDTPPAGAYYVQICATTNYGGYACDQSDSYFKIYDSDYPGNKPPTISGVSGPTTLKISETGTWTVQASDPENGPLSYSVIWGDEQMVSGGVAAPTMEKVQQTATFTHSYSQAGTYYPKFKVTDNAGQSNSTSLSVVVGFGSVTGTDLSVKDFALNSNGPYGVFCNLGGTYLKNFPFSIIVNNVQRDFDFGTAINPGQCNGPHQWYYATWGFNAMTSSGYDGKVIVDPKNIYAETNENNNEAKAYYRVVQPVSSVQVLSPNGGESWSKGSTQTISWGATGAPEVSVYLIKDSDPAYRLAIKHNHMSGRANSIEWTVPGAQTATTDIATGSDYRIWIIGGGATAVDDKSDRPFAIISQLQPILTIISSDPPNGAIDARQASSMTATSITGWKSIELKFSGSVSGITPSDFAIITSGGVVPVVVGTPFKATTAGVVMDTLSVDLDRPIPVNQRTRITYKPSGSSVCLGYLPGDVDQSGMVAPADILEMIDIMNGVKTVPLYVGDIDRSGLIAPADQLAFTDILNATNGKTLPACPSL